MVFGERFGALFLCSGLEGFEVLALGSGTVLTDVTLPNFWGFRFRYSGLRVL